jgi:serine/threonine protein kinase/WD40 repeat protein
MDNRRAAASFSGVSDQPTPPAPAADAIFRQALERLVPEERTTYLDEACAGDAALRAAVEALLRDYKERMGRAQTVTGPGSPSKASLSEGPGSTIGRYKLMEKIGEGGCGVVFLAEQTEPVQRRVALKVVRLGMDTEEVVARFAAERQALAMMEHPHIAQVLDAGATPAGRPFFVMELVRGEPITKFCDDHRLNTAARQKLFAQVCSAVQHAHQKGVIHRDLKPSNILVALHDGAPVPKVIDFGIAKATAGRLTDRTLFTAFEQFVGTPAYMSPEQAGLGGADVDTRSDVYSLGVLLYELLTGQPPLDPKTLDSANVDEVRRLVREVEPPRPSAQLAALDAATLTARAVLRGSDAARLVGDIRGDLDWIVMRCLEKDRTRRYDSASALAEDIGRHLENEPIAARPPGNLYLLQKLVRRHRAVFATAAAISLALIVGFGAALRSYFNERAARQLADEQTVLARDAHAATQLALSRADYLVALDLIERDQDPEAVAHLVRALRATPGDRASAALLVSVLTTRAWLVPVTPPGRVAGQTARATISAPPRAPQVGPGARGPGGGGNNNGRGGPGSLSGRGRGAGGAAPWPDVPSPDGKWILRDLPLDNAVRLYTASTSSLSPSVPLAEPMHHAADVSTGSFALTNVRQITTLVREVGAPNRRGPTLSPGETWNFPDRPGVLLALPEAGAGTAASWSPDGRMILTLAAEGIARTWDAATGGALSAPMPHGQPVSETAFSPDGKRLASLTPDNVLHLWTTATGERVSADVALAAGEPNQRGGAMGQRGGRGGPVGGFGGGARESTLAFSPDGARILAVVSGRVVRVRDAGTGRPFPALKNLEAAAVSSAAWSPDGRRILTTGAAGAAFFAPGAASSTGARLWDAATGETVLEFAKDVGQLDSAAFSSDGRLVLTVSRAGQTRQVHLWDAATGERTTADIISHSAGNNFTEATFSPDNQHVLTVTRGDQPAARVWKAETAEAVSALIQPKPAATTVTPNGDVPFSATFSPDGRWVVTEGRLDAAVGAGARVWDAETGLPVSVPALGERAALSPDGKHLLTTDADGTVKILPFADETTSTWLLDLAETLARCQLDATGSLMFVRGKPIEEIKRLIAQEKDPTHPLVIWARRLLAPTP